MLKRRILKLAVALIFLAGPAGGLAVADPERRMQPPWRPRRQLPRRRPRLQ